jgi:hypothetical protein
MLPLSAEAAAALFRQDRRKSPRLYVGEAAELSIPVENLVLPCVLVNISAGGAKVICDAIPPQGTAVELILKNGRRIAAVTAWIQDDALGLQFTAD